MTRISNFFFTKIQARSHDSALDQLFLKAVRNPLDQQIIYHKIFLTILTSKSKILNFKTLKIRPKSPTPPPPTTTPSISCTAGGKSSRFKRSPAPRKDVLGSPRARHERQNFTFTINSIYSIINAFTKTLQYYDVHLLRLLHATVSTHLFFVFARATPSLRPINRRRTCHNRRKSVTPFAGNA